jgi:hypothetical protein
MAGLDFDTAAQLLADLFQQTEQLLACLQAVEAKMLPLPPCSAPPSLPVWSCSTPTIAATSSLFLCNVPEYEPVATTAPISEAQQIKEEEKLRQFQEEEEQLQQIDVEGEKQQIEWVVETATETVGEQLTRQASAAVQRSSSTIPSKLDGIRGGELLATTVKIPCLDHARRDIFVVLHESPVRGQSPRGAPTARCREAVVAAGRRSVSSTICSQRARGTVGRRGTASAGRHPPVYTRSPPWTASAMPRRPPRGRIRVLQGRTPPAVWCATLTAAAVPFDPGG